MTTALTFNDVSLVPVPVTTSPFIWLRSTEIARALGYSDERSVSRIYARNAEEFSENMTQVVEMSEGVNFTTSIRIFSLRGCHLLAMFARTPVAKTFRRWVLDVLDRLAAEERAALPHVPHIKITPSTPASRKPLRSLVNAWARLSGRHQESLWPQVKAYFQLESIEDLPEEWLPDAIAWVQGRIDGLPKALPVAHCERAPLLTLTAEDLAALDKAAERVEELNRHVRKEIHDLHVDILERIDLRRVPFSAWEVLSDYIFFSLSRAADLPTGSLDGKKNPALAFKMLAGAMDKG